MEEPTAPLFQQIAMLIADSIADGALNEGERAPSTNELARFHGVNPATARRGLQVLQVEGLLEKRLGIGMFVSAGARERLRASRRESFARDYVAPLIDETARIAMTRAELHALIDRVAESRGLYA
ncbi:GntR family transcriptional regulator [Corynebacterium atypicum]|uniref:GntR family transcriptional regulator n=1 Tax=Corynebacterium atypicum TaxID=191610 RepID=A0ABN4DF22_9CORY|nr:GntR family transcriptional regulator [Corynebacterium atypicum]AIG64847.1 GntR family transcriptional regulator [Corynebacterium atypicum]